MHKLKICTFMTYIPYKILHNLNLHIYLLDFQKPAQAVIFISLLAQKL